MPINIYDKDKTARALKTTEDGGVHVPHHHVDSLPDVTVGSMPPVAVASMPALVLSGVPTVKVGDGTDTAEVVAGAGTSEKGLRVYIGPVDGADDTPVMVDQALHMMHAGHAYRAHVSMPTLGTTTVKIAIVVPAHASAASCPKLRIVLDCAFGSAVATLFEAATYTGGAAEAAYNRDRNSTNEAETTVFSGVASTNGTEIDAFHARERAVQEWILKASTTYRLDITGKEGATMAILGLEWSEAQI